MKQIYNVSILAPSGPPTSLKVTKVTGTRIAVQWEPVDCIQHNGGITGYLVWYGTLGNEITQTINVIGERTTLSMLMSSTTYSIKVAAVNSAGTGEFSPDVIITTLPS